MMNSENELSRPSVDDETSRVTRKSWVRPVVQDLPKLTDLTLQTGSAIPGTGGSGGSSVF